MGIFEMSGEENSDDYANDRIMGLLNLYFNRGIEKKIYPGKKSKC